MDWMLIPRIIGNAFGIMVGEVVLPDSIEGVTAKTPKGNTIILVNQNLTQEERIFAFYHELYHALHHALRGFDPDPADVTEYRSSDMVILWHDDPEEERQADEFAAAIIGESMPGTSNNGGITDETLSLVWQATRLTVKIASDLRFLERAFTPRRG